MQEPDLMLNPTTAQQDREEEEAREQAKIRAWRETLDDHFQDLILELTEDEGFCKALKVFAAFEDRRGTPLESDGALLAAAKNLLKELTRIRRSEAEFYAGMYIKD